MRKCTYWTFWELTRPDLNQIRFMGRKKQSGREHLTTDFVNKYNQSQLLDLIALN